MYLKQAANSEVFWHVFSFLENIKRDVTLDEVLSRFNTDLSVVEDVVNLFNRLNIKIELVTRKDEQWITAPKGQMSINIDLKLSEWASLYFLKESKINKDNPLIKILINRANGLKIEEIENFCTLESQEKNSFDSILAQFEHCIFNNFCFQININDRQLTCFAHRIVYIEDKLCVILESVNDRCLGLYYIEQLNDGLMVLEDIEYSSLFTRFDVDDFISGLRDVNDEEIRLVLKIKSHRDLTFPNPYFHLGNPYLVTNYEGDYIWAASIEASQELFEWLLELGDDAQILDPPKLQILFDEYVQKLRNRRMKKIG